MRLLLESFSFYFHSIFMLFFMLGIFHAIFGGQPNPSCNPFTQLSCSRAFPFVIIGHLGPCLINQ